MFRFSAKTYDLENLEPKMKSAVKFGQRVLDTQVLKDSNFFIPMDQHFLERSGIMHSKLGEGKIIWQTVYSRRLYYNPQYNFAKDKNPNAQGLWFEAAKALYKDRWLKMADKAIKSKL
jgi:hypothetical protein